MCVVVCAGGLALVAAQGCFTGGPPGLPIPSWQLCGLFAVSGDYE